MYVPSLSTYDCASACQPLIFPVTAALQEGKVNVQAATTASSESDALHEAVAVPPIPAELGESHEMDMADDMGPGKQLSHNKSTTG
jgi:hypothetical protein